MIQPSKIMRWTILWIAILAIILVPFFLAGARLETWIAKFIESAKERPLTSGALLAGLLASDILFPIPSSMVSTACGYILGFAGGTMASLAGMTVSCVIGYWLGRVVGRPTVSRFMKPAEFEALGKMNRRFGSWIVIICRPIPVLAEASSIFLGIDGLSFSRFFFLSALSNLGISAVYAGVGAFSASANSFLLAFAASIVIPGIAMLVSREAE